ncbi:hypothetical protein TGDOM2_218130 [Toxoplasma gondii GAB2-2007-GAL-DOM2]|uniref:Uncharacterized protein n=1 Tax=Toxoplasma gondii GAB2-2007-GAL-DOM2 TaxID=1130820 RepID=A0A086KSP6_TOXGO|nr:hypothetical protein TGDOM2_218130 [Toxoplasma gondii GAB2-2007-GAL-DOM2]
MTRPFFFMLFPRPPPTLRQKPLKNRIRLPPSFSPSSLLPSALVVLSLLSLSSFSQVAPLPRLRLLSASPAPRSFKRLLYAARVKQPRVDPLVDCSRQRLSPLFVAQHFPNISRKLGVDALVQDQALQARDCFA